LAGFPAPVGAVPAPPKLVVSDDVPVLGVIVLGPDGTEVGAVSEGAGVVFIVVLVLRVSVTIPEPLKYQMASARRITATMPTKIATAPFVESFLTSTVILLPPIRFCGTGVWEEELFLAVYEFFASDQRHTYALLKSGAGALVDVYA